MADTITLTSTTDDEAQVRSALGLPEAPVEAPAEPAADPAATGEPVAEAAPADADAVEEAEAEDVVAKPHAQQQAAGKKRGRLQSRIDELVDERNQMRGVNAASQAELDALRKRVADLVAQPPVAKTAEPAALVKEPPVKPKVEDFETYEQYTEAMVAHGVTVALADADAKVEARIEARLNAEKDAREKESRQQTQTELQRAYAAAEVTVKGKYEDYGETINTPDLKASDLMIDQMLKAGELGPEIAYYLGKHPVECKKLYALGNSAEALKAFGKIEARVEAALEAATASTAAGDGAAKPASVTPSAGIQAKPVVKPAISKAPDPITPVGAGAQSTTVDPSQMSYQDYREWRNAQERKRSGLR